MIIFLDFFFKKKKKVTKSSLNWLKNDWSDCHWNNDINNPINLSFSIHISSIKEWKNDSNNATWKPLLIKLRKERKKFKKWKIMKNIRKKEKNKIHTPMYNQNKAKFYFV